jgi:hypothetical protein
LSFVAQGAQAGPGTQRRIDEWVDRSTADPSRVLQAEVAEPSLRTERVGDYGTTRPLQEGPQGVGPGLQFSNRQALEPGLRLPVSSNEQQRSTSPDRRRAAMPTKDAEW